LEKIQELSKLIMKDLRTQKISVKLDDRDTLRPGAKFAQYELQGVPVRIAIGPKDLENNTVELARRDTLTKETIQLDELTKTIESTLKDIQSNLYKRALDFRDSHITEVDNFDAFKEVLKTEGGFISAHWDGTTETETKIKELTKATIRCVPYNSENEDGTCVFSGKPSKQRVLFAKAY
jgi:prolyl-tRNA synthetase